MTSLDDCISNTLKKYNNNVVTTLNEDESRIEVRYSGTTENIRPSIIITGADIVELREEFNLWSSNAKKNDYFYYSNKYYFPFLTDNNFRSETINISDQFINNDEEIFIGKLITSITEENVGKCLYLMSTYDLIDDNFKASIQKISDEEQYEEFTLKDIFLRKLAFIEIDSSKLNYNFRTDSDSESKLDYVEGVLFTIRAKMAYEDVLFYELVPYSMEDNNLNLYQNASIKVDPSHNRNIDAFSFFISAKNEKNYRMKFLDYYHVVEYFFYSNNLKVMRNLINEAMSLERMGNTQNPEDRLKILQQLFNRLDADTRRATERTMFEDLLINTVGYENLQQMLSGFSVDFLKSESSGISKTQLDISRVAKKQRQNGINKLFLMPNESIKDEQIKEVFLKRLASRLYNIRNFIVHSAKYKANHDYVSAPRRKDRFDEDIKLIEKIAYILLSMNIEI